MNITAETLVVAAIVLLAGTYLVRRYLRNRRAKAESPCGGGTCGCSAAKPPARSR
ncbi:FeoB-associated Cys-rich membrane protein [Pelagicoccus sp. NFK12]|uniref:FeoB-associated Cys-rich membrane protein n=1 Tax=Pelagicoccus enzymogenes TaxID=2773457 RepID=A0A927IGN1_9BACT|nr:FeoB-associated Cys-rich membrane protein [Pelagicoccus enzymogenes]MBD5778545.1 FeoB-associated Cys-rich membrane protein [Pelagicoccus enzymogenes]